MARRATTHYRYRGRCEPIEVLERANRWIPTPADQTAPGSQTLHAERTKLGLVARRGKVGRQAGRSSRGCARPTSTRSIGAAASWSFNDPEVIRDAAQTSSAPPAKIGYTFNWFYADSEHIAYFNSGANPVRAKGIDPDFPVGAGSSSGSDWNPTTCSRDVTAVHAAPAGRSTSRYFVNWNNKQARGYRAADDNALRLDLPLGVARGPHQGEHRGRKKMTLPS